MPHLDACENLRSVLHGVRQIRDRDGVLGAHVATAATIPAAGARGLANAGRIDGVGEADCHRRRDGIAQKRSGRRECLELGSRACSGVMGRPDPAGGSIVALGHQSISSDLVRPNRILENARVGPIGNARVDQRAAAEAAPNEDMHVLAETHVVEAGGRAHSPMPAGHLHLLAQIGKADGELAGQEFASPFQHRHSLAGPGEPGGGDAAAITGAHHDHVVVLLQAVGGLCEPGHPQITPRGDHRVAAVAWPRCVPLHEHLMHANGCTHVVGRSAEVVGDFIRELSERHARWRHRQNGVLHGRDSDLVQSRVSAGSRDLHR